MKMYSFLVFFLCLNVAAFILNEAGFYTETSELVVSAEDISATFNWATLLTSLGVGGIVAGLVALLTRQYVYAAGALIVWAIGSMAPVIRWFFIGVPLMLGQLLPSGLEFVSTVTQAFFAVIFFMFIIELVAQRSIT